MTDDTTNTYTYDAEGNILSGRNLANGATGSYVYDALNRRVSAATSVLVGTQSTQTYAYSYDRYGNRWAQNALQGGYSLSESFDAATNQTTAAGGYTYDAAGNMIYDGIHHYSYDAEGKVLTVDTTGAQFSYGAFDERVRVIQGSADTVILHNPFGNRVTEGNVTLGFTSEGISYWGTRPVAYYTASPAETQFEHQDYLGTERMRTSYNGAVEGTFTSLPFGDGFAVASGTDTDVYHFAGLEDDSSDDTDHAQFRTYSEVQGRWLSPDPYDGSYDFSNPQSFNRYAYVNNNPLTFTDPTGQNACGGSEGADGGFNFSPLGAIICGIKTLDQIIGRSHFHGPLTPRPAGTPDWGDDPGSFGESLGIGNGIKTGSWGIAGALGLPDAGCEFGACGAGSFGFQTTPVHGDWHYGNWCGAGGMGTPINGVDTLCMVHDLNLNKLKLDWTVFQSESAFDKLSRPDQQQLQQYNQQLCDGEKAALSQIPWWNLSQSIAAKEVIGFFQGHVPQGARCH